MKPVFLTFIAFFSLALYGQTTFNHFNPSMKSDLKTQTSKEKVPTAASKTNGSYLAKMNGYMHYSKDSNGVHQIAQKVDYTYNAQDTHVKTSVYTWDGSSFILSNSDTNQYNSSGSIIFNEVFSYPNQVKTPLQRNTKAYNSNQNITSELLENHNGILYDTTTFKTHYYSNNLLDSTESYSKPNVKFLSVFNYDINDNLVMEREFNLSSGSRIHQYTTHYTYDQSNLLKNRFYENANLGDTLNKRSYYFNAMGLDTMVHYEYKDSTGVFQPNITYKWTYDANQNEDEHFAYQYNNNLPYLWYYSHVHVDPTININDVLATHQYEQGFTSISNKVDAVTFKINQAPYSIDDSIYYDYETYIGLTEEDEWFAQIGPNPVKSNLSITLLNPCSASVFSMNGQLIEKRKLKAGENNWALGWLQQGAYILQFNDAEDLRSVKIIKQ